MARQNKKNTKELENLYKKYFTTTERIENNEEDSLLQPSPLNYVESFTTNGITEDVLVNKGN